jgi:putative endonuclease
MMNHNQRVGKWGEEQAALYLGERGYDIAARNVRTPYGEIDLIVRKEGQTVFVEVKTRLSDSSDPPETAVTGRKQGHMMASAEHYAQEHGLDHWRIDVIAVQRIAGETKVHHFENAVA